MSREIHYLIEPKHYIIGENTVVKSNGESKIYTIKLVSAENIDYSNLHVTASDRMKCVCKKILNMEKTKWVLRMVQFNEECAVLTYSNTEKYANSSDTITIWFDKAVKLRFEIERGEGMVPDSFQIICSKEILSGNKLFFRPSIIESLNSGSEYRILTLGKVASDGRTVFSVIEKHC